MTALAVSITLQSGENGLGVVEQDFLGDSAKVMGRGLFGWALQPVLPAALFREPNVSGRD